MGRCTFIFLLCIGTLGVSLADDLGNDITLCQDPNEEFVQEKSTCPGDSCMALVIKIDCRNAPPPQPGCVCRSGYLRLNESGPCVKVCDCPQMKYAPACKYDTATIS